ncbi:MAG: diversity-generating retroelement protein Avd, partial [Candidatus Omnitrophota bacterium]
GHCEARSAEAIPVLDCFASLAMTKGMRHKMKTIAPVVEKHYQLILWMLPKIANFPKDQRFLLADRIEGILLDILELLIEAVYSKNKREILIKVNLKLDFLRFMMRITKDMKYINLKSYDFFCQSTLEIGRMVGGWLKSTAL